MSREIIRELAPLSLSEITRRADVIIEATVHPIRTYLSPDECDLLTDYAVTLHTVLAGRLPASVQPGPQSLIVTHFGGEMEIGGVPVSVRDRQLPRLPGNETVILFLVRSSYDKSKYELEGRISGAFRVDGSGRVSWLMTHVPAGFLEAIPVDRDAFIRHVQQLKSRR